MYYIVYKITNTYNNKCYVGAHRTMNIDDGYMGSGVVIRRLISMYDISSFKKEVLFVYDNEKEMFEKEVELIASLHPEYNISSGGEHCGYGSDNIANRPDVRKRILQSFRETLDKRKEENKWVSSRRGRKLSAEHVVNMRLGVKKSWDTGANTGFLGKSHTVDAKKRIGLKNSRSQSGMKNSQFGKPRSDETKKKISESLRARKSI